MSKKSVGTILGATPSDIRLLAHDLASGINEMQTLYEAICMARMPHQYDREAIPRAEFDGVVNIAREVIPFVTRGPRAGLPHKAPYNQTREARQRWMRRGLAVRPRNGYVKFIGPSNNKQENDLFDIGKSSNERETVNGKDVGNGGETALSAALAKAEAMKTARAGVPKKAQRAPMSIEWLHSSQLFVDTRVLVNPRMPWERLSRLKKIAEVFDWNKFNPLKVAPRGDRYAILDGAGSWLIVTVIRPEFKDFLLPCHVVDERVQSRADESDIFLAQRNHKQIEAIDFFRSDLIHRDEEALAILGVLSGVGIKFPGTWPNGFKSVPVVRTLYRAGHLKRTMLICRDVWHNIKKPPNAAVIAVAIILDAHHIDEARLRKVLKDHDPGDLKVDVKHTAGRLHVYHAATHLAHKYVTEYDKAFKGTLLGGTRVGKDRRYMPHDRTSLNVAADRLINIWRFANKPATKLPSEDSED